VKPPLPSSADAKKKKKKERKKKRDLLTPLPLGACMAVAGQIYFTWPSHRLDEVPILVKIKGNFNLSRVFNKLA
jgi:hypothetical protein